MVKSTDAIVLVTRAVHLDALRAITAKRSNVELALHSILLLHNLWFVSHTAGITVLADQ